MHRVWKHLCLARRRDAWYALGRQRDSSPAGADVLAPTCVGVFFMAGCTGHKKDPISFEAGLPPSSSPAALYLLPCRIILAAETKQFCPVAPVIKRHISFEAGLAPSSSPAALYPLPCRIFSMGETKQFCPVVSAIKRPDLIRGGSCPLELPRGAISASLPHPSSSRDQTILPGYTGHKKDPISFEAGLAPSSSPAALYHLCFHHNRRTDSKKSTLPRQSALRLGCSVLASWCRIRQPSSPWPALRAPCCPR